MEKAFFTNRLRGCILSLGVLLILPLEAWSQANFVKSGSFKIKQSCQASNAIRNNSGALDLEVNKIYAAYGENKSKDASHVHIGVEGEGQRKWVSLTCGEYEGEKPSFKNGSDTTVNRPDDACLPFFDDIDNNVSISIGGEVDITPVAPVIEPFGASVNKVCGSAGKITSEGEFKKMLLAHPKVLADLMEYTNGKVFTARPAHDDQESYLDDLTEAWYAVSAFDHIFCGEPKGSIGGLHYHGRYQQLQKSGEACRLPNFHKNEVDEKKGIYSMGARMKRADGGWAKSSIKGYGLTLSAVDMLKVVTRAFAENPTSSSNSTGCLLDIKDGDVALKTVFVRRAKGIRTFFPDATPAENDPACANPVVLTAPDNASADNP